MPPSKTERIRNADGTIEDVTWQEIGRTRVPVDEQAEQAVREALAAFHTRIFTPGTHLPDAVGAAAAAIVGNLRARGFLKGAA